VKVIRRSTPVSLFPTFVWMAELEDDARERIHRGAMEWLEEMTDALRELAPGGSWQSEHVLHQVGQFAELVSVIRRMSAAVLEFLRIGYDGIDITGCWVNVSAPGAQHVVHHHPNNFLSGVYYVRVGAGSNTIQFHDPRPQVRVIRPPVRELTGENADMAVVQVDPGTLLLFPSWLEHSVPPNQGLETRISISFNLMFTSYVETMSLPAWDPGYR
jgi:uncharacterized protein (TIGR02466 family)